MSFLFNTYLVEAAFSTHTIIIIPSLNRQNGEADMKIQVLALNHTSKGFLQKSNNVTNNLSSFHFCTHRKYMVPKRNSTVHKGAVNSFARFHPAHSFHCTSTPFHLAKVFDYWATTLPNYSWIDGKSLSYGQLF